MERAHPGRLQAWQIRFASWSAEIVNARNFGARQAFAKVQRHRATDESTNAGYENAHEQTDPCAEGAVELDLARLVQFSGGFWAGRPFL